MSIDSFVHADRRELFDEHQRQGQHFDLKLHITEMIRDMSTETFADRMACQSLIALQEGRA